MTAFDSLGALTGQARDGVVHLLYRMADDELLIGHQDLEWTGQLPLVDAGDALRSMARDEVNHARAYFEMLHGLGEPDMDTLVGRKPRQFLCASLVSLSAQDWAFGVLRQFLYDAAETVRLSALALSSLLPLARVAITTRSEEARHMALTRSWVLQLGDSGGENRRKLQSALDTAYPHALGLFEPTEHDEMLAHAGIAPREEELQRQWESAAAPVLWDAGLSVPERAAPAYGGRVGRHPADLDGLLERIQSAGQGGPTQTE